MPLFKLILHGDVHGNLSGGCVRHSKGWTHYLIDKPFLLHLMAYFKMSSLCRWCERDSVLYCFLWFGAEPQLKRENSALYFSRSFILVNPFGCGKGKTVPLEAWSGPEGSRKLWFPDYMTTAQDDGKVVSPTHRAPLPPRNAPSTHFC